MVDPSLESPPKPPVPVTDGELLMRYARHGEEAALVEVIERHRAMIWGVCSRVLARRADAEDAYQATLLILARKAGSVRANDSAGGWLFRVAHNAAIAARRRHKRRRESSLEESPPAAEEAFPDLARQEVVAALLEELRSLPAKYQTALALRYLEGRSRREIAAALDATVATVAGQLVRGRRMLRSRLARRGVSLGLALGAFGTAGTAHAAGIVHAQPPVVNLSALLTGSSSAASAGVHGLVTHGMRSMFYASVTKPAAAGLAAVVATMVLLVEPPEGAAQANNGAPQLDATVVTASEEGTAGGPIQIATREAPGQAEPGTQDPGAPPSESAPAIPDRPDDEAAEDPVANALKAFAKKAKEEKDRDLSQPSFEELYWQYEHWKAELEVNEQRAVAYQKNLDHIQTLIKGGLTNDGRVIEAQYELRAAESKMPLARAKVAEFERLLKQAALRETGPKRVARAASRQLTPKSLIRGVLEKHQRPVVDNNAPSVKELERQLADLRSTERLLRTLGQTIAAWRSSAEASGVMPETEKQKIQAAKMANEAEILQVQAKQAELERLIDQAKNREKQAALREPGAKSVAKGPLPQPEATRLLAQWLEVQAREQELTKELPQLEELELELVFLEKSILASTADAAGARAAMSRIGKSDSVARMDLQQEVLSAQAEIARLRAQQAKVKRQIKQAKKREEQAALRETQQAPRSQQGAGWPVPGVISPPSNPYRASPEPISGGLPRLKPGDVVLIDSTLPKDERTRYQGPRTIEADGSLPAGALLGRLQIGGLTLREAEQVVQKSFDRFWTDVRVQLTIGKPTPPIALPSLPSVSGPIQAGEVLHVEVYDNVFQSTLFEEEVRVDEEGDVLLGAQCGRVSIKGKSLREAEEHIHKQVNERLKQIAGMRADAGIEKFIDRADGALTVLVKRVVPTKVYPGVDSPQRAAHRY